MILMTYIFAMWPVCLFVETETGSLSVPDMDPFEQMLIEHPSMSVYQMRCALNEEEEEEEVPNTDGDTVSRLLLHRRPFLLPLATLNLAL